MDIRKLSGRSLLLAFPIALMHPYPVYLSAHHAPEAPAVTAPSAPSADQSTQTTLVFPVQADTASSVSNATDPNLTAILPQTSYTPESKIDIFELNIPTISLAHAITPNVDPTDKSEYLSVIEKTVAHGENTALPSDPDGNTYLFAHSRNDYSGKTPNGGWFTRIDELQPGDTITVTLNSRIYTYIVTGSEIVNPETLGVYTKYSKFEGSRSLTLQTCYPRGSTSKRLIVYAVGV